MFGEDTSSADIADINHVVFIKLIGIENTRSGTGLGYRLDEKLLYPIAESSLESTCAFVDRERMDDRISGG